MNYPEFIDGKSRCSYCGKILEYEFLTVRENYLVVNFFDFENGEDNMFCDSHCLADQLSSETIYV